MAKIAILASGNGTNANEIMKYFANHDLAQVSLVLSNNSRAGVKNYAESHDVEYLFYDRATWRDDPDSILKELKSRNIDILVLAGFTQLIPTLLIHAYPDLILNIHPALLPNFGGKGMYGHHVHRAVQESGNRETGITIHLINEHYDQGEIIFQVSTELGRKDTVQTIQEKVQALEHEWYPQIIERFLKERVPK